MLSRLSKSTEPASPDANAADPVAQARTRARRRLIGAALLVGAGIIAFPLVFETQPRPIAVDLPIVIPRKEAVAPLTPPKPRAAPASVAEPAAALASAPASGPAMITETRADAGREVAPPKPAAKPEARAEAKPEARTEAKPEAPRSETRTAAVKPEARPAEPKPDARADEAARARDLLEGKDPGRTVVQVGAFADAGAARDVRNRVEKLGLKTYTQVVDTSDGKRIRVRVGPFASRDEADKAMAKLKSAGLSATVLTL